MVPCRGRFSKLPPEAEPEGQLKPGDDLVAAVAVPGSTIALERGTSPITQTLVFADNVILRGAGIGQTRLMVMLRGTKSSGLDAKGFSTWTTAKSSTPPTRS